MGAAREHGFNFLDDARYDDETGSAPIPTGYSEVLFGELFAGPRGGIAQQTVVSNKLWWEFWPEQSAAAELDGSLSRMGFDYVDLIYANPPPDGLAIDELVAAMGELVASGKARAWGVVNWEAGPLMEAIRSARRQGVQQPCAAQLPYSLVAREWVESIEMRAALEASGAGVVASFVMAGGVLTGKYDAGGSGRADGELETPRFAAAREQGRRLRALAPEIGCSPAALAIAFALSNPAVATVLFGATSAEQIADNVAALERERPAAAGARRRFVPTSDALAPRQPAVDQKPRDRDARRKQQLGVRPLDSGLDLLAREPPDRVELAVVGPRLAAVGVRLEAEHQRAGERPRLRADELRIARDDPRLLGDLAHDRLLGRLAGRDEPRQHRIAASPASPHGGRAADGPHVRRS